MTANDKCHQQILVEGVVEGAVPGECVAALLYTTFPTRDEAVAAGRSLVEQRQAGCINILPGMTAIYRWNGATELSDEVVLIAKVPGEHIAAAMAAIRSVHPYETPAILVLPVVALNSDYLAWLRAGTGPWIAGEYEQG